ncbi:MAG: InlB B-repeat-containing protein [Bacteroidales bacterium]|nr:InlB B-repeat-containing protein [Bacteroidales bacterium]
MKRFVYLLCSILFSMACLHVVADESRSMRLMSNGEVKASYIVGDIDSIKFVKTTLSQLSYDANGGTGEMKTQFFEEDIQADLYENTFVRENYKFVGWSTNPNGEGDYYADKEKCSFNEDVTLYAQWEQIVYTITFDANGGEGSMNPQEMKAGEEQAMSENAYTREYYQFVGWNTRVHGDGTAYTNAQVTSLTDNMTLYAQWERIMYTIKYDANGGEGIMDEQSIAAGQEKLLSQNVYTRKNYVFNGWNTAADGSGIAYENRQDVTLQGNLTLYAQWIQSVYTITFDANGGEGTMDNQIIVAGEKPLPKTLIPKIEPAP